MNVLNHDPEIETSINDPFANQTSIQEREADAARTSKLTGFLRWAGVILILFSALGFMLQGYAQVGAELRYWIGLLLTLTLAGGGILCAYALRETVGARIFFGLATLFAIVQSTQVGAMLYGWLRPAQSLDTAYAWLMFSGVSQAVLLLDLLITSGVMLVVGYAGFTILARPRAKILLTAFLLGNAMILLPTREAWVISLLLIGLFVYLRRIESQVRKEFVMQTWEGYAARALIFAPLVVLAGREGLYDINATSTATILGLLSFILTWELENYVRGRLVRVIGDLLGVILATLSWTLIYIDLLPALPLISSHVSGFVIPLGLLWLLLSIKIQHGAVYRSLAALMTAAAIFFDNTGSASMLLVGVVWTSVGIQCREKTTLLPGIICIGAGGIGYLKSLIGFYAQAPWISSAVLGFIVILLASWIEKWNRKILNKAKHYFNEIRSW